MQVLKASFHLFWTRMRIYWAAAVMTSGRQVAEAGIDRGEATRSEGGELDEVKEEAMTLRDLTADLQSGQVRIMYDTTFH